MPFGGQVITETLFHPSAMLGACGGTTQSNSALALMNDSPPDATSVKEGMRPISPPSEWLR